MSIEQVCGQDMISYVAAATAESEKIVGLMARLGSPASTRECDDAIIEYFLPRITSSSPIDAQAAYIDTLGRLGRGIALNRKRALIELAVHSDLSSDMMLMSVSDALGRTGIDLRELLEGKVHLSSETKINAVDDPAMYWLIYLWGLEDKRAVPEITRRLRGISDPLNLTSYLGFVAYSDSNIPIQERVNLVGQFANDQRRYIDLLGGEGSVSEYARYVMAIIKER